MRYTTALLTTLSASSSLAHPHYTTGSYTTATSSPENDVVVTLAGASELAKPVSFKRFPSHDREEVHLIASTRYKTVSLHVGKGVEKQDLRCKILNEQQQAISLKRGDNMDDTFSDLDKGKWTFVNGESKVSDVICDSKFVKGGATNITQPIAGTTPKDRAGDNTTQPMGEIRVILSGPSELAIPTKFFKGGMEREEQPVRNKGPFNKVELVADEVANGLRCKIRKDKLGTSVKLQRNGKTDTTFNDAGKGPWTFVDDNQGMIEMIVCDPDFKAQ